eukprot:GHVR01042190.1.p1 GENE.GHVR01042190.1~~GHVR01042190.1.p1  ORF type:complete len:133 (+),score=27.76 GHVR01042190.1:360-758(+)
MTLEFGSQRCGGSTITCKEAVRASICREQNYFVETQDCNKDDCPIPCEVSQWTEWECDPKCPEGDGKSLARSREVVTKGDVCDEPLQEIQEGNCTCKAPVVAQQQVPASATLWNIIQIFVTVVVVCTITVIV